MNTRIFIQLLCSCICFGTIWTSGCGDIRQVLLVSMDGFRWDYVNKRATPNFDKLAATGTKAKYINNSFITKTFPNHYTIVTGLYEESHGIIGNHMYDPVFNDTFGFKTTDSRWWDSGEPLWVTVRNGNLTSATYFWPGSEAEIRGVRPNKWLPYNESVPFRQRVDTVMDWLATDCINFVTLYFHEPDSSGHKYGPDASAIGPIIDEMDKVLGYILQKLESLNLSDKVDLIVTSDHGMTTVDYSNKIIDISTLVSMETDIQFTVDSGPIMQIMPNGNRTEVLQKLQQNSNMQVYLKEDIPVRWHYGNNRRVMPLFAVAKEGWSIVTNGTLYKHVTEKGNHGYDNVFMSMKPIFYARGPHIRRKYTTPAFKNVDIYTLVCHLLQVQESPNNGSFSRVQAFVVEAQHSIPNKSNINLPSVLAAALTILSLYLV